MEYIFLGWYKSLKQFMCFSFQYDHLLFYKTPVFGVGKITLKI